MLNIMIMLVILGLVVYLNVEPIIKSFSKEAMKDFDKETKAMKDIKDDIRAAIRLSGNRKACVQKALEVIIWELEKDIINREISGIVLNNETKVLGKYSPLKDLIFVDELCIKSIFTEKDSIKNFNSVLNTICHELRHAWQHDKDFLMTYFYITPETNYKLYKLQPMEVDARAFAAYFVHYKLNNERKEEILEHILDSIYDVIYDMNF